MICKKSAIFVGLLQKQCFCSDIIATKARRGGVEDREQRGFVPTDTPHYQNTPFDIPNSWQWVQVEDIALSINNGANIKQKKGAGGLPITRIETISNDCFNRDRMGYADIYDVLPYEKYRLNTGDILISHINSLPYLGRIVMYYAKENETIIHGMNLLRLIPDKNIIPNFIVFAFRTSKFKRQIDRNAHQAVNQASINIAAFSGLLIPLPPLAEQKRIVAEIEKWFALIDELDANKQDLQVAIRQVRAKVLDLAIHGKLVPQDPNDEPAIALLRRINPHFTPSDTSHYQNVPFDIPASWEWVTIGDISQLVTKGTTPRGGNVAYVDSGIGFLRAENVVGYKNLNLNNLKFITEDLNNSFLSRSKLKKNDLLITIAGTLGRTAIVTEDVLPLNANQAVSIVRLIDERFLNYVVYCLNSPIIQSKYTSAQKVTAIPNLTLEIIRDTFLPLPPLAEQKRIVSEIERIFGVLGTIEENIR